MVHCEKAVALSHTWGRRSDDIECAACVAADTELSANVIVLVAGGVSLVALFGLAALFGTPVMLSKNAVGIGAAAGILALASAIAVVIERLLEIAWTVVDQVASNPMFPFKSWASSLED